MVQAVERVHASGHGRDPLRGSDRQHHLGRTPIFAWASFAVPYWLTAYFLGPTFPALLGAMVGLLVTSLTLRAGYFLPEEEWEFGPRESWPAHWVGEIEPGESTSGGGGAVAADGGTAAATPGADV